MDIFYSHMLLTYPSGVFHWIVHLIDMIRNKYEDMYEIDMQCIDLYIYSHSACNYASIFIYFTMPERIQIKRMCKNHHKQNCYLYFIDRVQTFGDILLNTYISNLHFSLLGNLSAVQSHHRLQL